VWAIREATFPQSPNVSTGTSRAPSWRSDCERDGENLASGGHRTPRIPEHLTDTKANQLRKILQTD
jgi:hypothetical protein